MLLIFAEPIFDANDSRFNASTKNTAKYVELVKILRDFNIDNNLPRLISSRQEARNISALLTKDQIEIKMDFDANRENAAVENLAKNVSGANLQLNLENRDYKIYSA